MWIPGFSLGRFFEVTAERTGIIVIRHDVQQLVFIRISRVPDNRVVFFTRFENGRYLSDSFRTDDNAGGTDLREQHNVD